MLLFFFYFLYKANFLNQENLFSLSLKVLFFIHTLTNVSLQHFTTVFFSLLSQKIAKYLFIIFFARVNNQTKKKHSLALYIIIFRAIYSYL
jgi:hypothetical protein